VRTRVKICGITRQRDALDAARYGADAIGFVFWARSPRAVDVKQAADIRRALPPFVSTVALFVDPEPYLVQQVIESVAPDLLQFHGDEEPDFCASFNQPWLKALKVGDGNDLGEQMQRYRAATGFLLDSHDPVKVGGTGQAYDWSLTPDNSPRPLVIAGGLTPLNVAEAVSSLRPWAVDVSSGVELDRGIKDSEKIRSFMHAVRAADVELHDRID